MSNGQSREIHFYKNTKTGKIDYETDRLQSKKGGILNNDC